MKRAPNDLAAQAGMAAIRLAFVSDGQRVWDCDDNFYRLTVHPATGWVLIERETDG